MIKTSIKYAIGITLILILFATFTFTISFPDDVMEFLISGGLVNVFRSISYFLPLKYMLLCLTTIFLSKHSTILILLMTKIYRVIMDFVKG